MENKFQSLEDSCADLPSKYLSPHIELIIIKSEQNILGGSGNVPNMPGDDW